jgi:hypothetical protein
MTAAVKFCVCPALNPAEVGDTVTVSGVAGTVMVAVAERAVFLMLVAVSVTVCCVLTGYAAVYVTLVVVTFESDPLPLPMLHVTPSPELSKFTVAVKPCELPLFTVAELGVMLTVGKPAVPGEPIASSGQVLAAVPINCTSEFALVFDVVRSGVVYHTEPVLSTATPIEL